MQGSHELELLLVLVRQNAINSSIDADAGNSLLNFIDQKRFFELLEWHRLTVVLSPLLNQLDFHGEILASARTSVQASQINALTKAQEVIRLNNLFKDRNISCLFFKGVVLAKLAYNTIAARSFGDIDVFVNPSDYEKARNILLESGYKYAKPVKYFQEQIVRRLFDQWQFIHPDNQVMIELHWGLFDTYTGKKNSLDLQLWNNVQQVDFFGTEVNTLSDPLLIIYLSLHNSKHYWERIEHIVSFSALAKRMSAEDWEKIEKIATVVKCKTNLSFALYLAHQYTGIALPAFYRYHSGFVKMEALVTRLWKSPDDASFYKKPYYTLSFIWRKHDTARNAVKEMILNIIAPQAADIAKSNSKKTWKYYLIRLHEVLISKTKFFIAGKA